MLAFSLYSACIYFQNVCLGKERHDEFGGGFTLLRIQNITSFFYFTLFGLVVVRLVTFFFLLGFLITTSSFIYPRLSASSSFSALKETLKYQHKAHTHTHWDLGRL